MPLLLLLTAYCDCLDENLTFVKYIYILRWAWLLGCICVVLAVSPCISTNYHKMRRLTRSTASLVATAAAVALSFDVANIFVNATAPAGPWDAFNYAPESKTVYPSAVRQVQGNVVAAENLVGSGGEGGSAVLEGEGSYVVLDFGKEVRFGCPTLYFLVVVQMIKA